MRYLELKFAGTQYAGSSKIEIDGKPANVKKNEFKNFVCNYETNNGKVNVKIYRLLDVGGIFWFLTQIFFFLISIFGIFDVHGKKKCWVIDFEAEIDLNETNNFVTLKFAPPQENGTAVLFETDLTYREISNKYYIDVKAKKTLKALKITKILLAVGIIAGLALFAIMKLFGG